MFGGMALWLSRTTALNAAGRVGPPIFGMAMLGVQGYIFFGPPPVSPAAIAVTALAFYLVFAAVAQWLDRQRAMIRPISTGEER
jgi:hypothetical protein